MSANPWPSLLRCTGCDHEQLFQRDQMIEELGERGMLRRNAEPESDLLAELWVTTVAKLTCKSCGETSLTLVADDADSVNWGDAKLCELCQEVIPAERLEIFPNSSLCVACQSKDERGEPSADEVDYCPHCGSIREMRQSQRGGLAGYRMVCPACRR